MWITAQFPDEGVGSITGSVCRVYSHLYMSPEEAEANAALILAAPELLAAAKVFLDDAQGCGAMGERELRAAIAKATGNAS
jgi:hypothetical protein